MFHVEDSIEHLLTCEGDKSVPSGLLLDLSYEPRVLYFSKLGEVADYVLRGSLSWKTSHEYLPVDTLCSLKSFSPPLTLILL